MLLENIFVQHKLCQALIMRSKKLILFNTEITAMHLTRRHNCFTRFLVFIHRDIVKSTLLKDCRSYHTVKKYQIG